MVLVEYILNMFIYAVVRYKIGDLGHAMAWNKEEACGEEGDCRYMAPEFLKLYLLLKPKELELILWSCRMGGVSGPQLAKADVFSLGLSVYEAARLRRFSQASCSVNSSLYICAQVAQER